MSGERMQIFIVIALLFALFVAIFALSNSEIVNIRFFGNIYSMSQALIIIGCTVFGALAVMVLGLFSRIRTAFKMREYKNKIKNLENELEEARREIEKLKENINMLSNNKIENN
ncbi:LapA family protein [Thermovenabulum sp.]|uniref:LapA family protein n=1 Tax=Thermovenabulum sp. TaxID=3100335 RepID=UPI003C7A38DC